MNEEFIDRLYEVCSAIKNEGHYLRILDEMMKRMHVDRHSHEGSFIAMIFLTELVKEGVVGLHFSTNEELVDKVIQDAKKYASRIEKEHGDAIVDIKSRLRRGQTLHDFPSFD